MRGKEGRNRCLSRVRPERSAAEVSRQASWGGGGALQRKNKKPKAPEKMFRLWPVPLPPPKEIEKNKKLGLRNVAILELLDEALGRIGQVFQVGNVHYVFKGIIIPPTSLE